MCSCSSAARFPRDDAAELQDRGVAAVFTPGSPMSDIVSFLNEKLAA